MATERSYFGHIVWPMAVAQTLVWAATFYGFAALLPAWESEGIWTKAQLSGAFTLALFVSAFLAPITGRQIDRGRGQIVLIIGPILATAGLVLLSQSNTLFDFYAAWGLLGVGMAGSLYDPCFAYLTRVFNTERRRAITRVTLVAGLAGSFSFLGYFWFSSWVGWRGGLLIAAVIILLLVLPLNIYATQVGKNLSKQLPNLPVTAEPSAGHAFWRQRAFWLLTAGIAALSLNHSVLMTHIRPLLSDRGLVDSTVVLLAATMGPMQVAGRLVLLSLERRLSIYALTVLSLLMAIAGAVFLLLTAGNVALAVAFITLQGAGHGMTAILRPILTAEVMGRINFGLIAGTISIVAHSAVALSPSIAALTWGIAGYDGVLLVAIAMALVAMLALLLASRSSPASQSYDAGRV
jgi:predicted MFS family arabinose efflux permease